MKLFVILSRFPYPLEKGDKLRAFHQIRTLSKSHSIYLCCLSDQKVSQEQLDELSPYCEKIDIIRLSKIKIFIRLLLGIFSRRPFQYHYFYDKAAQKKVNRLIEHYLPKHIYCQLIRTGAYLRKYSVIHKTIDYMDALSAGMQRRSEVSGFPLNLLYRIEAKRLGHFESELFGAFQQHCIISEQDRDAIKHPRKKDIHVIANGISDFYFEKLEKDKIYDLVFTGNMNYSPNIMAACFLAKDVLPLLHKKGFPLKLLIAGANPSPKVKALASQQVEVSGWLDDIRDAYSCSRIFVAPMFIGSGLQNKLLEAMAQEMPCITTELANNALGASDGSEVLIAKTKEEFVEKIIDLSTSNDKATRIGQSARHFVKENYSWDHQSNKLSKVFETQ